MENIVKKTAAGTRYLTEPRIVRLAETKLNYPDSIDGFMEFAEGFEIHDPEDSYLSNLTSDLTTDIEKLTMAAGQVCYLSLGKKRSHADNTQKYINNILASGHGSVLEHSSVSYLVYGVSRSLTHELARHRHLSFSQLSQRYVDGNALRFVERPEFQEDPELHAWFESRIDAFARTYEALAESMREIFKDVPNSTDRRKAANQTARALLPNETETCLVVSGNLRAWRTIMELRASPHAEPEIRRLAYLIYEDIKQIAPSVFNDYNAHEDGTISTEWMKV